ncbi:MAG: potassium-transporting ATPase subunit KdpB [Elusimicrobia bacterium]|nr:potassium-transporting ATPase subunit KdpB [Elusimicrobiota bacterium]
MAADKKPAFDKKLILESAVAAFKKLDPRIQARNPVMFVTLTGAVLTTAAMAQSLSSGPFPLFEFQISLWLWFTVLFANFAEALAESRGKAQAESLRKSRVEVMARLLENGKERKVPSSEVTKGDMVVCEAGDIIPADGEVVKGIASVDESAITGESAPVIRESGGDRSAVTGGTRVISDKLVIRVTAEPGKSFIDRMIALIEGAKRQKTPNEIALVMVLAGLTLIFLLAVSTLKLFSDYTAVSAGQDLGKLITVPVLVSLLVCLIPTTIGGLLSAIGIAGMDRLIRRNVIAKSGRAVEAAGDIGVLLLDKTGTITLGNRMATAFIPAPGISEEILAEASQLASLSDETPEGRSIVVLAKKRFELRARELHPAEASFVPFSAATQMSGIDMKGPDGKVVRSIRKGAVDAIREQADEAGLEFPAGLEAAHKEISRSGGTPLGVAENGKIIGLIHLKDMVKGGIKERFAELRKMGIRTVMITGDNPLTAAAIAAEAGVDDFISQATPESKLARIRREQEMGHLVAMTGDGTNDAPALAQADVGVTMNTGTQAAREAGNMVDLESNPTKLIEIVEIGKQLLMTRGARTTFSIANDVAKYFAIIPALFATLYMTAKHGGALSALNIMGLHSPQSAILSAVIFNAIIIVLLIPLALRGVAYRPESAGAVLRRNILIYGAGGIVAPFIGIKLIDMLITAVRLV